jgi:hypothetical protein
MLARAAAPIRPQQRARAAGAAAAVAGAGAGAALRLPPRAPPRRRADARAEPLCCLHERGANGAPHPASKVAQPAPAEAAARTPSEEALRLFFDCGEAFQDSFTDKVFIPGLSKLLDEGSEAQAARAAQLLERLAAPVGEKATSAHLQAIADNAVPVLIKQMAYGDARDAAPAARVLGALALNARDRSDTLIKAGAAPALVKLLYASDKGTLTAAIEAISSLKSCNNNSYSSYSLSSFSPLPIDAILDAGALPRLTRLLDHDEAVVAEGAARVLCSLIKIDAVVKAAGVLPGLVRLMGRASVEGACCIASALEQRLNRESDMSIRQAVMSAGAVPALVQLLGRGDASAIKCALDALKEFTQYWLYNPLSGEARLGSSGCKAVAAAGGVRVLASLLGHSDAAIVKEALSRLEEICSAGLPERISGEPEAMARLEALARGGDAATAATAAAILRRVKPEAVSA